METLEDSARWYCLRSQPKRERVAAGQLKLLEGVEVFLPLVAYRRNTAKGQKPTVEPMFPNYLFARFDARYHHRAVGYAKGVAYIVKRGEAFQEIAEAIIAELRSLTVSDVLELTPKPLQIGETVRIVRGIFAEYEGTVIGLRPAAERVVLLMELLGREQAVELPEGTIATTYRHPVARG